MNGRRHSTPAVFVTLGILLAAAAQAQHPAAGSESAAARTAADGLAPRGIVKAVHQAALSTELTAPIARIGFREGERFPEGAVLIQFDCRRQTKELDALAATVREAKVAVEANEHLVRNGASNRNEVEVSRARHDKATAEWQAMDRRLEGCRVAAPWSGVVTELAINAFETPQPGKPLISIANDRELEIELIVPSRLLGELKPGSELEFAVDEMRKAYPARIVRTGRAVDPMSQTGKLFARFTAQPPEVLPGMSGSATFGLPAER